MIEEEPIYPECRRPLTGIKVYKDNETGEITIEFFCDEAGEDIFRFQIITGLTAESITGLREIARTIQKRGN